MSTGGFIYAIGAEGSPHVKLGSTRGTENSIAKRLKQLQIGQPSLLTIRARVSVAHDVQRLEKALHRMLAPCQQRGEWFALDVDQYRLESLVVQASQYNTPDYVGQQILRFRQKRGMSQRQLATAANVPQPLISQIESGKRAGSHIHLTVAARLAFALGVSVDSLVGELVAAESAA
jgi:DNA-binding XRE family transcriptional regulator